MPSQILPICDFCEEEDASVGFNPDWDAMTCTDCDIAMAEELRRIASGENRL